MVFYILLLLCIPNVPRKYYHRTGSDKLYAQHIGVMVIIALKNVLSTNGADKA